MQISQNHVTMIIGTRGSGKTELLKFLLRRFKGYRVLIYDSEHEFEDDWEGFKVYKPYEPSSQTEFDRICGTVWEKGNYIMAVESIDFFVKPKQPLPPNFAKLVHWGRKRGIGLMLTSRRIASVHKDPCSQVHHWFIFYSFLPNDIRYLREFVGKIAEDCGSLKPYEFLYWSRGEATRFKPIKLL